MKEYKTKIAKMVVFTPLFLWFVTVIAMFYLGQTLVFFIVLAVFTGCIVVVSFVNYAKIEEFAATVKAKELELASKNKALKEQLYIDNLTGLPNLKSFDEELKNTKIPKVIVLNIDSFKDVNEFYGKKIGDFVLIDISKMIKEFAKQNDMKAYRIGSDEFALLDSNKLDITKYESIVAELVDLFKSKEIVLDELDETIVVDTTIGFSLESENSFNKAVTALNFAKSKQKDFACYIYSMDTKVKYEDKLKYVKLIKNALENDKVIPYFQPINNRNNQTIKYECLSRVLDEDGKAISPYFFMGTSKKARLYSAMAKKIIDLGFRSILGTNKTVSINLLPRDMMDSDISNFVTDKIREYKIAKQVVFEILEDENIEHLERVSLFIDKVKRMGVRIAIDDFGTGYSNFSYLLNLKPDYLKIDGSIIKNIDKDKNSEAIVKALISFAKTLHVKTIAEFIHSKEVYDKCYELGVDEFQGYYLGKPNPDLV